jgi:cytochrome P450
MAVNGVMAYRENARDAPGPGGGFIFGSGPKMFRNPLAMLETDIRRYGPMVRYRFLNTRIIFVSHPAGVEHVLHTNHANYTKATFDYRVLKRLLGEGLLTSENPLWLRQRRLIQPMFHRSRVAGFGTIITEEATRMLTEWSETAKGGQPFDVAAEMMRVTLRIVARTLLSLDIRGDDMATVSESLSIVVRLFGRIGLSLLSPFIPTAHNRRVKRAIRTLRALVDRLIADRVREGIDRGDLLSMLIAARDAETGEPMPRTQIRDEVLTLLLAGHETTANALAWTFFLLCGAPEVETRLQVELGQVLGERPPTVADLPRLPYTAMVIDESLRLYPPAWAISRAAQADDVIMGYRVPRGTSILLSQWITHRLPEFWEEPLRFMPERFAPEREAGRPRYAYFPFGGGPRLCIGEQFALVEAKLVLATVAQRYRLRLLPGLEVQPDPLVTLRPRGGIPMTLEPTRAAAASLR